MRSEAGAGGASIGPIKRLTSDMALVAASQHSIQHGHSMLNAKSGVWALPGQLEADLALATTADEQNGKIRGIVARAYAQP